jgi:hypothetical protein
MKSKATKDVYMPLQEFDQELETCLTIVSEPTTRKPYYVCIYVSPSLERSAVHVYITK